MQPENYILLIALLFMFGFMFWQNKKRKTAAEQMTKDLQVGATVVLYSGIVGEVLTLGERNITIKSATSTLEVVRGAVRNVEKAAAEQAPAKTSPAKTAAAKPAAAKNPAAAKKPAAK